MKIELNKQLDKEVYMAFCDAVVGGADFGKKNAMLKNFIKTNLCRLDKPAHSILKCNTWESDFVRCIKF